MTDRSELPSIAITNALMINEGSRTEVDVIVKAGRIDKIGSGLSTEGIDKVIDANGRYLLPGCIDDQVHFREPGLTHKADIWHESRASVAGGTTTFMEMPNTNPTTTTLDALEAKYARAAKVAHANHAFFFGASNDNLDELRRLKANDTCGVKVFMGSSTGNMLVDKPTVLRGIFRDSSMLIATHCEDTPMIKANEEAAMAQWGLDTPFTEHPNIRSREACYASSKLAVDLAREFDARLHILHLTTAEEMSLFRAGPVKNKRITAEACVHHLWFESSDYARKGSQIKCNPAVKLHSDREALRQAVRDDVIDVIATDHAPHTWKEKQGGYFQAPAGLPLTQHHLPALVDMVHDGVFTWEQVVHKAAHAVADLFEIDQRGYIREGYWADLVLVDPTATTTVARKNIRSKCGWSPFEGHTFRCCIDATIVSGYLAYENGRILEGPSGMRLNYTRES